MAVGVLKLLLPADRDAIDLVQLRNADNSLIRTLWHDADLGL